MSHSYWHRGQKDVEALRAENQEYRTWLAQPKDAIPIMVPQLIELKKQVARLNTSASAESGSKSQPAQQPAGNVIPPAASAVPPGPLPSTDKSKPRQLPQSFTQPRTAKLGSAGFDESTGAVVTVKQTFPDQTATLILTFPDRTQGLEERVYAGKQFKFTWGGRTIVLTVLEITFLTDTVKYRMQQTDA